MEKHKPTPLLRFVTTQKEQLYAGLNALIGGQPSQRLQQLWTSDYSGVEDEWRDVPLVVLPDETNAAKDERKEG